MRNVHGRETVTAAHRGRCALRVAMCVTMTPGGDGTPLLRLRWKVRRQTRRHDARRVPTQRENADVGRIDLDAPPIKSKRRRRFTASRETAEEMTTHSHRRRQSIFQINAALRAAATLFSIVTQDGQRRIFQRSQPTAPKPHVGVQGPWERRVGRRRYEGSACPIKAAFLWGATPVSLGKGQRNGVAFYKRPAFPHEILCLLYFTNPQKGGTG